ncbi:MAG: hypothetical protein ACSHYB_12065 [Roseibacillus sp.]
MNEQLANPPSLPERKKINHKLLWLALMGPIALMALLTGLAFAHLKFDFISTSIILGSLAVIAGWILFGFALFKRMPTAGYVICLIAYPLVQAAICVTLFFFGCLTSWEGNWGHSAPDSWVEEQERRAREDPIDPVELEEARQRMEEAIKGTGHDLQSVEEPIDGPTTLSEPAELE